MKHAAVLTFTCLALVQLVTACGADSGSPAERDRPSAGGHVNTAGTGGSANVSSGGAKSITDQGGTTAQGGRAPVTEGGTDAGAGAGGVTPSRSPRKLLLVDEGKGALHYIDLDAPSRNWTNQGAGRDLQLVGNHHVLESHAKGFIEFDLEAQGAIVRNVEIPGLPGSVDAARRLANGNTVIAGNSGDGVFVWELDHEHRPVPERRRHFTGVATLRSLRFDNDGANFFFCSTVAGTEQRSVHQGDWGRDLTMLFQFPREHEARNMYKAVPSAANEITVSTGYGASLVVIDTSTKKITKTIGGKDQPLPEDADRTINPNFYGGFQILPNGDYLVTNWQGHGPSNNKQGYQLLQYDSAGKLVWFLDQTKQPQISSLQNVLAIDGLDTSLLHDERAGIVVPIE